MGYIVFCAICGGPTNDVPIAKRSRRAWLRQRPEETVFEIPGDEYRDYFGYDPEVVSKEDIAWVHKLLLLGLHPDATGSGRAFMTGVASHYDYALAYIQDRGDDPNLPEHCSELECYQVMWSPDGQLFPAYPVHPPCLSILRTVLTESDDAADFDKDVLYHVMHEDVGHWSTHLNLDYGTPDVDRGCWGADAGEEVIVKPSLFNPSITAFIEENLATGRFARDPTPPADLSTRIVHDPFSSLPYDLIHGILLELSASSIIALCNASFAINSTIAPIQSFWKKAIEASMPWFWEAHNFITDDTVAQEHNMDFKRVFLWLEKSTRPAKNMEPGPFMSIANRRRIWYVCHQLEAKYRVRIKAIAREQAAAETRISLAQG